MYKRTVARTAAAGALRNATRCTFHIVIIALYELFPSASRLGRPVWGINTVAKTGFFPENTCIVGGVLDLGITLES